MFHRCCPVSFPLSIWPLSSSSVAASICALICLLTAHFCFPSLLLLDDGCGHCLLSVFLLGACPKHTHTHTLRGNYYLRPLFLGRRTLLIASLTAGGTYLKCVYVSSNGRGNGNGRRDADSDTQKCEGPERCSDCGCGTATPNNTHQTTPLMSAPFSITEPSKKGKSCER